MKNLLIIVSFITLLCSGCNNSTKKYSLGIKNAKIWTGENDQPWAEVMICSGDKIALIGTEKDLATALEDCDTVFDGNGKLVLPGFIDCHVHTIMGGTLLNTVQLKDVRTKQEFINRIKEYALTLQPGEWILGGNWDHQNWGGELPTHHWIDSVTTQNPVWIERSEGHSGLANKLAMEKAQITKNFKDVKGGIIERLEDGAPSGVFKDDAMFLIFKVIDDLTVQQKDKYINDAMDYFLSEGITSAHHMIEPHERNPGGHSTDYEAFKHLQQNKGLRVRFYIAQPFTDFSQVAADVKAHGKGDMWLKTGVLKGYVDGAIGSHSALFFDDYNDKKGYKGNQVNSDEVLYHNIQQADSLGLQLCIHAIGDKGIYTALKTFDAVIKHNGPKDRRFRIEHTQHIRPQDAGYMGRLGVIASMQPYHAIDDGIWCENAIGHKRALSTYAAKMLMDSGVRVAFGSDWFVAPPSPLKGIYAAVTRRTLDGKNPNGWIPEQKITVEQAVRNYTVEGAYASFDEDKKGSLKVGKLADWIILKDNIFDIDPIKIWDSKIEMTVVGGKIAYKK